MRGKGWVIAGVLGACGDVPSTPPTTPAGAAETARDPYEGAEALWKTPVTQDDWVRRTLYTWTTADQIAELRTGRVLLTREESPDKGASFFEQVVHELAQKRVPIAQLLDSQAFAKSRFAWPAPWATRGGWAGEQYGDQLIRITLKPGAIVLALSTADMTFRAKDLTGADVKEADVLAHPERIGAVFFQREAAAASYREFVVNNESMIESWAVGTQDIVDEVRGSSDALAALARGLAAHGPSAELRRAYARALAFDNPSYALDHDVIVELVNRLRGTPKVPALEGGGDAKWAGLGPARTPPRTKQARRYNPTYGTY